MRFLSFEGIDSSGKSTLKRGLERHLEALHIPFLSTREPGGTPLAEKIRRLLLEETEDVPVPRAELLLYEASRAQNVDKLIKPALLEKKWVLCDRFTASSVAFQAGGRGAISRHGGGLEPLCCRRLHSRSFCFGGHQCGGKPKKKTGSKARSF